MRLAGRAGSLRQCERGAVAIEFGLIAMVAICLFLGIIEFGRAYYMRNELSYAADLAARTLLTNPAVANSALESTIRSAITFGGSDALSLTFGAETIGGVAYRTLSMRQPLTLLIPTLSNAGVTLKIDRRVPLL